MIVPPILCVSANPGLDFRLRLPTLAPGRIIRAKSSEGLPGGKAVHVAMAAQALGARAIWLGFLGGGTGEEVASKVRELEIEIVRVPVNAPTRVNLEILEESGRITEILSPGAPPKPAESREMLRLYRSGLRRKWRGALVVISGRLPSGVPSSFYRTLIRPARSLGSLVFLDTSGEALRASLSSRPAFVKPNQEEVEALLGRRLENQAAIVDACRELVRRGAASAAVSLGAEGLIWLEQKNGPVWLARPPHLNPVSTVGCGDATVGGFAIAAVRGLRGEAALTLATACGAANCLAESPGRISSKVVEQMKRRVKVHRIA